MHAVVIKKGFKGRVQDVERGVTSGERLYYVDYEDGDNEHFTDAEVRQYQGSDATSNALLPKAPPSIPQATLKQLPFAVTKNLLCSAC